MARSLLYSGNPIPLPKGSKENAMAIISTNEQAKFHDALQEVLTQANTIKDGQLSSVNLAMRYDSRVGAHIHASARVTQRISVTVHMNDGPNPIDEKY